MTSETWARICAVSRPQPTSLHRWWIGPNPWPGIPSTGLTWQCCPDDGPTATIEGVQLHLPRNPHEPSFTVVITVYGGDEAIGHLVRLHGFGMG